MHRQALQVCCLLAAAPSMLLAAECKLSKYAELPVTMVDTRPMIAGSINGVDGVFLADSGSFFSMLTRESAEKFKLRLGPDPAGLEVRGATGGVGVRETRARDFMLAGFGLAHNVDFLVAGSDFAGGADGIIGQNLLGFADTEYDLGNGVIRLFHASDCGKRMLAYWSQGAGRAR